MSAREYNIVATYTNKHHKEGRTRRYLTPDSALARATFLLTTKGKPGDVITLTHAVSSMYLGHLRIKAGGIIVGEFVWDKPEHVAIPVKAAPRKKAVGVSKPARQSAHLH